MSAITDSAKNEMCQIRLPGICNHDPETTVFCHFRMKNDGGSIKPDDIRGAYGCFACHNEVDRRTTIMKLEEAQLAFAFGVFRTQDILKKKGLIKC